MEDYSEQQPENYRFEFDKPLAEYYNGLPNEQQILLYKQFRKYVEWYIDLADINTNENFQGCMNEINLQPDQWQKVFDEHRSFFITEVKAYREFAFLYLDFLGEKKKWTPELYDELSVELWEVIQEYNESIDSGLDLLSSIYSCYLTSQWLNLWLSENEPFSTLNTMMNQSVYSSKTDTELTHKSVKIDIEYRESFFALLSRFFDETAYDELKILLSGDQIDSKLDFKQDAVQLINIFWQAIKYKLINRGKKKEVIIWLSKYFTYQNGSTMDEEYVRKRIYTRDDQIVCPNPLKEVTSYFNSIKKRS